nr:immunoglobulin light chain junction region [Macaca mulatta]
HYCCQVWDSNTDHPLF